GTGTGLDGFTGVAEFRAQASRTIKQASVSSTDQGGGKRRTSNTYRGAVLQARRLPLATQTVGCSTRAPLARGGGRAEIEDCYCLGHCIAPRSLQRLIGDFREDIFLDLVELGGEGGAVVH